METNKKMILEELKNYYNFNNDTEFAKFLNIPTQTLSSWEKENYFDLELVYSKCKGVNLYWLITGEGDVVLDDSYSKLIRIINTKQNSNNNNQQQPMHYLVKVNKNDYHFEDMKTQKESIPSTNFEYETEEIMDLT